MQQVADYYEVDYAAIRKCYNRNKEEINEDGAAKIPVKSMLSRLGQDVTTVSTKGYKEFKLSDDVILRVPNAGILLFPKRAILRIGMLLRDSEVAKEVRTQLLNIVENSADELKIQEIETEQKLYTDLTMAIVGGNTEEALLRYQALAQYLNRHIAELTEENEEVKADNKMLTAEILQWDDRKCLNRAIRVLASQAEQPASYIWSNLYKELLYKHSISLRRRGKAPYVRYIKEKEWPCVQQSLSALCEQYGVSPSYVCEQAKISYNPENTVQ
jgi:hypothetical protein